MNENREQVYELLTRSVEVGDGDEQVSLREEAVRLADLGGDLQLQYFAREVYVRACVFGGAAENALVAFSWLLAQFDKNPGKFDEWAILWKYKWIVGTIYNFPQVSKARIYEMLDDLSERSLRAGYGLRAVYNHRYRLEKFWDNREKAVEYFNKMEELPEDGLSNCPVCVKDERVSFSIYSGNDSRALELAKPLLSGGEKCATVPHRTYANLLLPLVRLGQQKQALLYHRRGYPLISSNKNFLDRIADHLILLTLTGNFSNAVRLVEKHYVWTETNRDVLCRFRFFRAAWLLFEMLAETPVVSKESLRLNLPWSFPLYSESRHYDPVQLASWLKEQADEIARRFDARNETDFFVRTLAETPALKELCAPFPLADVE